MVSSAEGVALQLWRLWIAVLLLGESVLLDLPPSPALTPGIQDGLRFRVETYFLAFSLEEG